MNLKTLAALGLALLLTPSIAPAAQAGLDFSWIVDFTFVDSGFGFTDTENPGGNTTTPVNDSSTDYTASITPVTVPGDLFGFSPVEITCNASDGDCPVFGLDFIGWQELDSSIDTILYDVKINGTLNAPAARSFDVVVIVNGYDDSFNFIDSNTELDNITIFPGEFSQTLFSGRLNAIGTMNVTVFGNLSGFLGAGESLILPDSFDVFTPRGDNGVIPEPSTIALLLGGVAALGLLRRKQR